MIVPPTTVPLTTVPPTTVPLTTVRPTAVSSGAPPVFSLIILVVPGVTVLDGTETLATLVDNEGLVAEGETGVGAEVV